MIILFVLGLIVNGRFVFIIEYLLIVFILMFLLEVVIRVIVYFNGEFLRIWVLNI